METTHALREYGLTEKESKVYLELLSLGSVTLQEIAKRIDLPRTTIYNTLNYLVEEGLVSYITKKNVRHYEAANPEKLLDKIKEKKEIISKAIPELKILQEHIKEGSSVEIYHGHKGQSTVHADIFKKKQEIFYFGPYTLAVEVLKHQPAHYRMLRLERKIPAKIIIEEAKEEIFKKKSYQKLTEMRLHKGMKEFPCMIFIYGKKVAITTLKNDIIGIIIKNEQVAKTMKLIFNLYWAQAKPAKLK